MDTVTLEAMCDRSPWMWNSFFGMPGCLNDNNVVESSPCLKKISEGVFPPPWEYCMGGLRRNKPYWFRDGIYALAPSFLTSIGEPRMKMECLYAQIQVTVRKDIERALGMLQRKWTIISRPSKLVIVETMEIIMMCAILLQNMCLEERNADDLVNEVDEHSDFVVGGGVNPMWCELARLIGQTIIPADVC